ncbi:MAG: 50S ribosomal protein L23 [Erysipelotrichaceae bacterium]|jgi:large subunit ribosomal protein L23|nr:50S ribosomal protein L23 [Erysipelotrichaceae bacterium]
MARAKKPEVVETKKAEKLLKPTLKELEVIIEPVYTEKAMLANQAGNTVTFKVRKDANRLEIKKAIQALYNVNVEKVRVINVHAKEVMKDRRHKGTVSGYKKAIVKLQEGSTISLFEDKGE